MLILAQDSDNGVSVIVTILAIIFALALLALWISAIVSIARNDRLTGGGKFLWIVVTIGFPLLGSIGWFAFGKRAQLVKRPPDQPL
jgi:hypothetical protein